MDSPTILFHPTRADSAVEVRRALHTLQRLRDGWQPDAALLAGARRVERWSVRRATDAVIYQFIGHRGAVDDPPAVLIGTALAIDPRRHWALLAGEAWVTLGAALQDAPFFDPADVCHCAEIWLRAQRA
jgi:hypothetical protein